MEFTVTGLSDWEVVQQTDGFAIIKTEGDCPNVQTDLIVRVYDEFTDEPITEWEYAEVKNGKWSVELKLPAGGPYRMEIRQYNGEVWKARGGLVGAVHHFCVGDVYIIAGQSNAIGTGHGEMYEAPEIGIHTMRNCRYWDLATNPMYAARGNHGPFLSFAKRLKKALNYPIGLIPCAFGGSSLAQWLPDEDGVFYREMLEAAKKPIKGILWYQGECEGMGRHSENYYERFERFVKYVRSDFDDDKLPVITVQLGRHTDDFPDGEEMDVHYDAVREAQRRAANTIEGVYIVPAIDAGRLSDGIHNSKSANMLIGERMAKMALYKLYNKGLNPSAPNLESAICTDANKIILKFKNVEDTLMAYHVKKIERFPVLVEDENGVNNIVDFDIKKDIIEIVCERNIGRNSRVKCQYGRNPLNLIQDFGNQSAVLCFSNVEVEIL